MLISKQSKLTRRHSPSQIVRQAVARKLLLPFIRLRTPWYCLYPGFTPVTHAPYSVHLKNVAGNHSVEKVLAHNLRCPIFLFLVIP